MFLYLVKFRGIQCVFCYTWIRVTHLLSYTSGGEIDVGLEFVSNDASEFLASDFSFE